MFFLLGILKEEIQLNYNNNFGFGFISIKLRRRAPLSSCIPLCLSHACLFLLCSGQLSGFDLCHFLISAFPCLAKHGCGSYIGFFIQLSLWSFFEPSAILQLYRMFYILIIYFLCFRELTTISIFIFTSSYDSQHVILIFYNSSFQFSPYISFRCCKCTPFCPLEVDLSRFILASLRTMGRFLVVYFLVFLIYFSRLFFSLCVHES